MKTTKIDDVSYKRLVLVKQIFDRSNVQPTHSYAERILVLIGYDLANETALKAVISSLSTKQPNKDHNFGQIISEAAKILDERGLDTIPYQANLMKVRTLRNSSQHDARNPSDDDLSDARTYTKDFLEKLFQQVWTLNFQTISMRSLVRNDEVRERLDAAYKYFDEESFSDAACEASIAFQHVKGLIKRFAVGRESSGHFSDFMMHNAQDDLIQWRAIAEDINGLRDVLFHSLLGLDLRDYLKFDRLSSGFVLNYLGGNKYSRVQTWGNYSKEEAEFVLQFATNATVAAESLAGELEKPFGIDPSQRPYLYM